MTGAPLVSVLIPTYQYADYLPQAVDSVLGQDLRDFELLVVDDASTDGTREVLERYRGRDPRLRCEVNPRNLGMMGNWHRCLSLARGRYVKFLFGDDYFLAPDALSRMVAVMEAHPSVSLVASARLMSYESALGTETKVNCHWADGVILPGAQVVRRCLEERANLVGEPTAVLYRREQGARGFDPSYRQMVDLEMWMHLLEKGEFAYLADPLVAFRRHDRQQTEINKAAGVHYTEWMRLFLEHLDRPELAIPLRLRWYLGMTQMHRLRRRARRGGPLPPEAPALMAEYGVGRYLRSYPLFRVVRSARKIVFRLRG